MKAPLGPIALRGRRATVVGLGLFGGGVGVARFLAARGARVTVTDLRDRNVLARSVEALAGVPIEWRLGEHRVEDFTSTDLVVSSPGVPRESPFLAAARAASVPVETEIGLLFRFCRARPIGVTGSNGKTTTTALLGAMFREGGFRTYVGGNIGGSLLDRVDEVAPDDVVVLELSSFQLEYLGDLATSPESAVVTTLTANHLDRHGSMEAYAAAKKQIVAHQRASDAAFLNRDDPAVRAWRKDCPGSVYEFSIREPVERGVFVRDCRIVSTVVGLETPVADVKDVRLPGGFNVANVCAALGPALRRGVEPAAAARAIASFAGVPHRLECVRELHGVRYLNDSIATNPESTIAALEAFTEPIVLIAGGYDKKLPIEKFAAAIRRRVRTTILLGATAHRLHDAIAAAPGVSLPDIRRVASIEEAVDVAHSLSSPGDLVLLSPGFASFDQFVNFEERGDRFRRRVEELR
ncbi:MAG: UDP-N-acetylmuramoyl-L-alanine--D-glutamate ligase [Planctomycetes bacterium]|nr:UDP-N-acetylmuramoyl-L-alanine--D-glutamate ligase [Planctomycetota bacterium]